MIKYFCDACGEETESLIEFKILCHIEQDHFGCYSKIDQNGNWQPTSGRRVVYGLCDGCYNKVAKAAYNEFDKIRPKKIEE